MILGDLNDPTTYSAPVERFSALEHALHWIQTEGRNKVPGQYPIEGGMRADVQSVETQARTQGKFEAHRKFIDLHFCLAGGEIIEWAPMSLLEPKNQYNDENDVQHFLVTATPQTALRFIPDRFALFFPGDAHMPKVYDETNKEIKKVVVKVPVYLLK